MSTATESHIKGIKQQCLHTPHRSKFTAASRGFPATAGFYYLTFSCVFEFLSSGASGVFGAIYKLYIMIIMVIIIKLVHTDILT